MTHEKSNLHIILAGEEKHTAEAIKIIKNDISDHSSQFCMVGSQPMHSDLKGQAGVEYFSSKADLDRLINKIRSCGKLILHGLWLRFIWELLLDDEALLQKTYWIPWGGDFYFPQQQPQKKRECISKIKKVISFSKTDSHYIERNYAASFELHEILPYPGPIMPEKFYLNASQNVSSAKRIILGNSATATNNHEECLNIIRKKVTPETLVFAPLSYGSSAYADYIANVGRDYLGKSFIPINRFLKRPEYWELLNQMDAGVFGHDRQQAFSNMCMMLNLGKTIYVKSGSPNWHIMLDLGFIIRDIYSYDTTLLTVELRRKNMELARRLFNYENLKRGWKSILRL